MSSDIGLAYPAVSPYLYYEDGVAALDWLAQAFGFRERFRQTADDGRVQHAELEHDGGVVMLGCPDDYKNPAHLGANTSSVYVRVADVDAVHQRATEAGAEVLRPPTDEDYGARMCGVRDPEGHEWWFAQDLA